MLTVRVASWFVVALLASLLANSAARAAERPVDFSRDIKPILSNYCYTCHGPDEAERQGGLRLDEQEGALAVLESGSHAIVPGNVAESTLVARILAEDPAVRMPPSAFGKTLSPEQIALLKRWVEEGAQWRGHWSFIAPVRVEPPVVQQPALVRNPIDQFVLSRLDAEGLTYSTPADRITLLRRVTFDLTGLPPTAAEVDAFLADTSSDAYERVVDRLLASPRFGEHLGRYWLDAARYGDTHGLHLDNERSLWPYRDWVINALNSNMPFNQFTVEQVAGDLLPGATIDQQIATGFNRCNVTTGEGGSIDEEVLVRYGVDRVEATSTVWLGLTTGCAVCHDHKFDPISQRDFYQFYAFFNGVAEQALDGNVLAPPPILRNPTTEQKEKLAQTEAELTTTRQQITDELAKVVAAYVDPIPAPAPLPTEPQELVWVEDELPAGAVPATAGHDWQFVSAPDVTVHSGTRCTTRTAEGAGQHFFTGASQPLRLGEGDKLFAYVYLDATAPPKSIMLQFNDGSWEHRAFWGEDLIPYGSGAGPAHLAMGPLPAVGQWVRLEVDAAQVGLPAGTLVNGLSFAQFDGKAHWDRAGLMTRMPQTVDLASLAAWEQFERVQPKSTLAADVLNAIKADPATRTPEIAAVARDYYLKTVCPTSRAAFEPLQTQVTTLEKQRTDLDNAVTKTMVMAEMPQPRDTFMLVRGAYDKKGDKVTAGVLSALPPLPAGAPVNRLGLAQWLVDPSHPLTSRVIVNRYWQHYFGTGIVRTAEDFGSQGAWPTHPELLDWLATEFIRSGWDIKQMQRLLVTSAAYRQSSRATPELLERDAANELLARGPRFRLDAEVIRDSALAAGGLLVERLGGRSVKTYQPDGVWEAIAFVGSNTSTYQRDAGDALYRRSLYTFWKRTSPPPSLSTFDAPSRENCTVRRARTNTPLQALVLMNDIQYVEAARRLAERMMTEAGATAEERVAYGFRICTARTPTPEESAVLVATFGSHLADYQADKDSATKLLAIGESKRNETLEVSEHAAWTMVANLLLNLDETVTKE